MKFRISMFFDFPLLASLLAKRSMAIDKLIKTNFSEPKPEIPPQRRKFGHPLLSCKPTHTCNFEIVMDAKLTGRSSTRAKKKGNQQKIQYKG